MSWVQLQLAKTGRNVLVAGSYCNALHPGSSGQMLPGPKLGTAMPYNSENRKQRGRLEYGMIWASYIWQNSYYARKRKNCQRKLKMSQFGSVNNIKSLRVVVRMAHIWQKWETHFGRYNICANCWLRDKLRKNHPESSPDMYIHRMSANVLSNVTFCIPYFPVEAHKLHLIVQN